LPERMCHLSRQGEGGRTLVLCLDPKEQLRSGVLTPSTFVWPRDGSACSLSQVLESGSVPKKYYLSGKAAAGILRRAERRGKDLPPQLKTALEQVVMDSPT